MLLAERQTAQSAELLEGSCHMRHMSLSVLSGPAAVGPCP